MTDEKVVKDRWPHAVCKEAYATKSGRTGWFPTGAFFVYTSDGGNEIGYSGKGKDEAWQDAAERLRADD